MVNQKVKPAIVIPAFQRSESLKILLSSLNNAMYPDGDIPLIISLEHQANPEVIKTAEEFNFSSGYKKVIYHQKKRGLKDHIFKCANYTDDYGSVILLEDDLIVSPAFYLYAEKAMNYYNETDEVAGISLYAQRFNETAQLPFEPMPTQHSAYFMQLASSWGQAWTKKQWNGFKEWLKVSDVSQLKSNEAIPENIRNWPNTSWKKLFNYYLIDTNKFFVYPQNSLSSNNSHFNGENVKASGNLLQVPLMWSHKYDNYSFPDFQNAPVIYDMFMEQKGSFIKDVTGFSDSEIEIDLYGFKPQNYLKRKKYFITSNLVADPVKMYPLRLKPLEMNLGYPSTDIAEVFFSLTNSKQDTELNKRRHHFIQLAHYFSYSRLKTKKFIISNLLYSLANRKKF